MKMYLRSITGLATAAALVACVGTAPAWAQGATTDSAAISSAASASVTDTALTNGAVVSLVEGTDLESEVTVAFDVDGTFAPVEVEAVVDGESSADAFDVETFTLLDESGENYAATLRSRATGEVLTVNTTMAQQQALPVIILALLARQGLQAAIKFYGKAQVKKAAKSYLLNNISAQKWGHIMDPKHRWSEVGARSRDQIADIMGSAMANGRHSAYGSAKKAEWTYNGRQIVVTYSPGGQISNGWVVGR